jgi:hypothetical protein
MLNEKHFLKNLYTLYQRKVHVLGGGMFGDAMRWVGRNAFLLLRMLGKIVIKSPILLVMLSAL